MPEAARHLLSPGRIPREVSISASAVRLRGDDPEKEEAMKYMLLIHQGDAPTPRSPDEWGRLSEDEQKAVYGDYKAINETPGVSPGAKSSLPKWPPPCVCRTARR